MNTEIKVDVYSNKGTVYTRDKINQAYEKVTDVVKKFTRFDANSELSRLNSASGKLTVVSKELFDLIKYSLNLATLTKGRYDPTIIDLLELYGYTAHKKFNELDDKHLFKKIKARILARPSYQEIELDKKNLTIKLANNQRLDLGGIGKGYSMRLMSEILDELDSFIIEAGGDITSKGYKPNNKQWTVGLTTHISPETLDTELLGTIDISNQSLSSSGSWATKYRYFHHLLNTSTGLPENQIRQTFVLGKDPMDTDAWATAVYLYGLDGVDLLDQQKLEGLIIDKHGNISTTDNFTYNHLA